MIWLIGSAGMLGRELASRMTKHYIDFVSTDKEVDISDITQLISFSNGLNIRPIWIFNCAAYTAVDKAESETDLAYRLNTLGPKNIAKVADLLGARLLHVSTDYVFRVTN